VRKHRILTKILSASLIFFSLIFFYTCLGDIIENELLQAFFSFLTTVYLGKQDFYEWLARKQISNLLLFNLVVFLLCGYVWEGIEQAFIELRKFCCSKICLNE